MNQWVAIVVIAVSTLYTGLMMIILTDFQMWPRTILHLQWKHPFCGWMERLYMVQSLCTDYTDIIYIFFVRLIQSKNKIEVEYFMVKILFSPLLGIILFLQMKVLYVLVEYIKNILKQLNNTHVFDSNIALLHPQWVVAGF